MANRFLVDYFGAKRKAILELKSKWADFQAHLLPRIAPLHCHLVLRFPSEIHRRRGDKDEQVHKRLKAARLARGPRLLRRPFTSTPSSSMTVSSRITGTSSRTSDGSSTPRGYSGSVSAPCVSLGPVRPSSGEEEGICFRENSSGERTENTATSRRSASGYTGCSTGF